MPPQQNAKFFCARPDGSLTPLIAVDEFPHGISVGELPRVLAPGDTQGMTSCGLAEARSEPWAIDGVAHVYARHLENDRATQMHQLLVSIMADTGVPARVRTSVEKFLGQTVESNPTNGTELSLRMTSMPPMQIARNMPAHGQSGNVNGRQRRLKKYCSYWIRHGECDYAQQGCMYKHDMPLDMEGLSEVGLRDIPRWYRELHGLPSLLDGTQGRMPLQIGVPNAPRAITQHGQSPEETIDGHGHGAQEAATTTNGGTSHGLQGSIENPPRGPKSNGHNAAPSSYRGGSRTHTGAHQNNPGWKGRGNRNRGAYSSPRGRGSGVATQQTPVDAVNINNYGKFGGLMSPDPSPGLTGRVNVNQAFSSGRGMSILADTTSTGQGESRDHPMNFQCLPVAQDGKDSATGSSEKVGLDNNSSGHTGAKGLASKLSTDGGVKLPDDDQQTFTPASSHRSLGSNRTWLGFQQSPTNVFSRVSNTPSLADLISHDIAPPIRAIDTRVSWGFVGGPVPTDGTGAVTANHPTAAPMVTHWNVFGEYPEDMPAAEM